MVDEQVSTVLRKKTEATRAAVSGGPVTPERAIRHVFAKVAQDSLELPLEVRDVRITQMSLTEICDAFEPLSMLAVIEGHKESFGVIALPPMMFSSLIEVQTMGRLGKTPPAARKPTRVDASMMQGVLDELMGGLTQALCESDDITWAGGFRYASHLDDPRPLALILEEITYRVIHIGLRIGPGGERETQLLWAVPARGRGPGPVKPEQPVVQSELDQAAQMHWFTQMEHTVMGTRAQLDAVIYRWRLPLSEAMGLRPDVVIGLPQGALENIMLEAPGGRLVGHAKLGQYSGKRALRLREAGAEEDMVPNMDDLTAASGAPPSLAQDHGIQDYDTQEYGGLADLSAPSQDALSGAPDDFPAMDTGQMSDFGLGGDGADDPMDLDLPASFDPLRTGTDG